MPLVPIDMTTDQRKALRDFQKKAEIKNVSEFIRQAIRQAMQERGEQFPPDGEWGGKRTKREE